MDNKQLAQGLAGYGRNGDTMLMHVTPNEVSYLQGLANSYGGSLTQNPVTGLPEASFFESILPTVAGIGLNAALPGLGALGTGLLVGGVTAAATGDISKGLTAGLGGFGGAGIGNAISSLGSAGSSAASGAAASGAQAGSAAGAAQAAAPPTNLIGQGGGFAQAAGMEGAGTAALTSTPIGQGGLNLAPAEASNLIPQAAPTIGQNLNNFGSGLRNAFDNPGQFVDALGGSNKAAFKLGVPLTMAALNANPQEPFQEPGYNPNARLNLSGKTGLRFAEGGVVPGLYNSAQYAPQQSQAVQNFAGIYGNAQQSRGIADLMRSSPVPEAGLGNSLGQRSQLPGGRMNVNTGGIRYLAEGGYLVGEGDGMSDDIPAVIDGEQPAALTDGEFVVPADVVSGLGNGSSNAGAKQLYDMLQRVRMARTGSAEQASQINPREVMPR